MLVGQEFSAGVVKTRAESEGREPGAGAREEAAPSNPPVSPLLRLLLQHQPPEEVRLGEGAEGGPDWGLGPDDGHQVKISEYRSVQSTAERSS